MKINIKVVVILGFILFFLPVSVYALSNSSKFLPKAQRFIDTTCNRSKINNQDSLLCYLFFKIAELDTKFTTNDNDQDHRINSIQSTISDQATVITDLQQRVYDLENPSSTPPPPPNNILFEDDFEGSINPSWYNQNNSFLSTQLFAQNGNFSITTNGIIDRMLVHDMASNQSNTTAEAWFYDGGGDVEETLVSVSETDPIVANTSQNLLSVGLDTRQSKTNYAFFLGWNSTTVGISRTVGWHKIMIKTDGIYNNVSIDNAPILSTSFQKNWRFIVLYANGWEGNVQHNKSFWDNVSVFSN